MFFQPARRLIGARRSASSNRRLGILLAFVAGAINAGGFLAVAQYTSHMTGMVSAMADNLVLGAYPLVLGAFGALVSFILGAACSALLVNYGRRRRYHSKYAIPLLLEALLLLCFGLLGARLATIDGLFVPLTVMLLCFIMGLQNAVITKISKATIRTTHITGLVTDLGIELGKLLYVNQRAGTAPVLADRRRLHVHIRLIAAFFGGGVAGALGFKAVGYISTVPLAIALLLLVLRPALDDWRRLRAH